MLAEIGTLQVTTPQAIHSHHLSLVLAATADGGGGDAAVTATAFVDVAVVVVAAVLIAVGLSRSRVLGCAKRERLFTGVSPYDRVLGGKPNQRSLYCIGMFSPCPFCKSGALSESLRGNTAIRRRHQPAILA